MREGGRDCYVVGIDEAGRGSLVGEMMIAAVAVPCDETDELLDGGVKDSKLLSPRRRAEIYRAYSGRYPFIVIPVKPQEIDENNLGEITASKIFEALRLLSKRIPPGSVRRIVIDRFGKPRGLRYRIHSLGYKDVRVVIEEKADARYPEVSLASIFAKHLRDKRIELIRKKTGLRGSGYPSDPETIESLEEMLRKGEISRLAGYIRLSWATIEKLGIPGARPKKSRGKNRKITDYLGVS